LADLLWEKNTVIGWKSTAKPSEQGENKNSLLADS